MFHSEKFKLVFLEVPRTSSFSITKALTSLDPTSPTVESRRTEGALKSYHDHRSPHWNDSSYRFVAGCRNPYDRLWSFWKHRSRWGNPEIFKTIGWAQYIDWVCDPESVNQIKNANLDIPIVEQFDCERIDLWLRFENLKHSWNELSALINTPLPVLELINTSSDIQISPIYSRQDAERIFQRFEKDFEFFGYEKDSWKLLNSTNKQIVKKRKVVRTKGEKTKKVSLRGHVGIVTPFRTYTEAFSLNRVVQDQICMLSKNGYKSRVFVIENLYWDLPQGHYGDAGVELVQLPRFAEVNHPGEEHQFVHDVELLIDAMIDCMSDLRVVFTHDIIYQPRYLKLSIACRRVAESLPQITWYHWIHSATSPGQLKRPGIADELFPEVLAQEWKNSHPVYFNRMSIPRIASNFGYEEKDVMIVPHPTHVAEFLGLSPTITRLYEEKQLYIADYTVTYPVRMDPGKQVHWITRIMSRIKAAGNTVRVIIMDFHSLTEDKNEYREFVRDEALEWGLDEHDLIFLSEFDESLASQAPHSMVRELLSLSTVFIQPSRSESYSYVVQEAAIMGNLLILNDDFPPMREIYGEQALYFQFSSGIDRIRLQDGNTALQIQDHEFDCFPSEFPEAVVTQNGNKWVVKGEAIHADLIASRIQYEFENNLVLGQRQKRLRNRNLYSVFKTHIQPLLNPIGQLSKNQNV